MSKRQLIDDIRQLNPTAQPQFLAQFDEEELQQYLDHVKSALGGSIYIGGRAKKKGDLRKVS
jgi:hypothetical protein